MDKNGTVYVYSSKTVYAVGMGKITPAIDVNAEDVKVGEDVIINIELPDDATGSVEVVIGNITQNKGAISGIVNVVSLGSSFLCGCFVPFEFMPDYVIKIAHIFPTYYFVINNEALKVMDNFSLSSVSPLILNMGIVLIFGVCFVIITNYVSKKKQVLN